MAQNEFIGEMVGNSLGKLEEVDLKAREIEWGEFMSVKIRMDF